MGDHRTTSSSVVNKVTVTQLHTLDRVSRELMDDIPPKYPPLTHRVNSCSGSFGYTHTHTHTHTHTLVEPSVFTTHTSFTVC